MSPPIPNHHSVAKVAKMLGVSTRSVKNYLKSNELGHVKLGTTNTVRISDEHIRAFLKK